MPETKEFLEGLEKRMQIVAVVDAIVNRRQRNMELESIFQPGQMENIIISVLVFIMERTLAEDEECTLDSITFFLQDILPDYGLTLPWETVKELAGYIIKDVLQYGGEVRYYPVMKYGEGMKELRIKLIDDRLKETHKGYESNYLLTDQGYDFLFRTKEVEREISFTIEELKLRELIKRKNYRKAQQQSASLVQMLRQKKREMQQFILKVRENIYEVDVEEYENLLNSTYELLEEEYGLLNQIRDMVVLSEERLQEEEARRISLDADMEKARRDISSIRRNLNTALKEQREMVVERYNLSQIYLETITEAFSYGLVKRYDLEKEILHRLEQCPESLVPELWRLLNPLFLPSPDKKLNLFSIYQRQVPLREVDDEGESIVLEELDEDRDLLRVRRLNEAHVLLFRRLFHFAAEKKAPFRFSSFLSSLKEIPEVLGVLLEENLLFTDMLKLYEMGPLDVAAWEKEPGEVVINATGELDMGYCLHRLTFEDSNLFGVAEIKVTKVDHLLVDEEIEFQVHGASYRQRVIFSDFLIEVKPNESFEYGY
ncbi:MAG TPA: hypothetical protein GX711_04945 [Clostridia bacterium]|nr:hypothetical protein [Clostridia bacterium]